MSGGHGIYFLISPTRGVRPLISCNEPDDSECRSPTNGHMCEVESGLRLCGIIESYRGDEHKLTDGSIIVEADDFGCHYTWKYADKEDS